MKKIIIDTDIGDDIDDALALAFAAKNEFIDLIGVTTVHAEVELRTLLAAKILQLCGRSDIPIATGLSKPLKRDARFGVIDAQASVLDLAEKFDAMVPTPAHEFLRDKILQSKEPVTLVPIGPLTNIGRLLLDFPEVKTNLEEIALMGGFFGEKTLEYNILMDPYAAQIVFDSAIPVRIMPFDHTQHCAVPDSFLKSLAADTRPLQNTLSRMTTLWTQKTGYTHPVLHDPLAVGCLVAPQLYKFQKSKIGVDPYGMTSAQPDPNSTNQVCTFIDNPSFINLFTPYIFK